MKKISVVILLLTIAGFVQAQNPADTAQALQLNRESRKYFFSKPDSSLLLSQKAYQLVEQTDFYPAKIDALNNMGEAYRFLGDFGHALETQYKALELNNAENDSIGAATTHTFIGFTLQQLTEYRQSLDHLLPALAYLEKRKQYRVAALAALNAAAAYEGLNDLDSALTYCKDAIELMDKDKIPALQSNIMSQLGTVLLKKGQVQQAFQCFHSALYFAENSQVVVHKVRAERNLANIHLQTGNLDSALIYAHRALADGKLTQQKLLMRDASASLAEIFAVKKKYDSAFYYQSALIDYDNAVHGPEQFRKLQALMLEEQRRTKLLEEEKTELRNRIAFISLFSIIGIIAAITFLMYRNNQQKQKTNQLLVQKNEQIEATLEELKNTQTQLVQREKMASLGELTAGIAHEIKNPLNFVNNFAEVNAELISDMLKAVDQGDLGEVKALAEDIRSNQEKITEHGKRADGIVNSMLQHSRNNTGQKEPTDLNKLVQEYMNLAFHGMKAKDKTFNCALDLQLDPDLPLIKILPQDIGRVILNLLNNAFYAVNEKMKTAGETYKPIVAVQVKKTEKGIQLSIKDNGIGVSTEIRDKIFQPFFTTKPTGEGTGLGLSLSYDIVTKGHGGKMSVESKDGETDFTIILPE